jgi:hypothetical protein
MTSRVNNFVCNSCQLTLTSVNMRVELVKLPLHISHGKYCAVLLTFDSLFDIRDTGRYSNHVKVKVKLSLCFN